MPLCAEVPSTPIPAPLLRLAGNMGHFASPNSCTILPGFPWQPPQQCSVVPLDTLPSWGGDRGSRRGVEGLKGLPLRKLGCLMGKAVALR